MTSHCARRILPPGGTRKRKEREAPSFVSGPSPSPAAAAATTKETKPMSSNGLLAGYMAHEFLTRGTLLGQKLNSEGAPSGSSSWLSTIRKEDKSEAEMASIVKSDGTHIPGIVNPSQLSRWIGRNA